MSVQGLFLSGSPKSTLCGLRSGRGCGQGSSLGSPNGPSQPASPPGTLNLLREAAGRVAHLRINDEELYALNGFAKYHKYDVAPPPCSYPSISQPQPFQASTPVSSDSAGWLFTRPFKPWNVSSRR